MLRFALHTPLKPLDHPIPSGDRAMGRALANLLRRLGHTVEPVDSYADGPMPPRMTPESLPILRDDARRRAAMLIERWSGLPRDDPHRPTAWFTYHVWYKRPDWLGPAVARALDIPYVIAEASYAPKRAGGPWDLGHRATEDAARAADLILTVNPDDAPCLLPLLATPDTMHLVPPFLDAGPFRMAEAARSAHRATLCERMGWSYDTPILLAVAMMRPPDKVASYDVLAQSLRMLLDRDWRLVLVGDGEARAQVEQMFAAMGDRIGFAGAHEAEALPVFYGAADIYVWPAVNEAFGISLLEAQAAGLPVIAGRTRGVPAVVAEGETGLLPLLGDAGAFAAALRTLLDDPAQRLAMGRAAAARIDREHDLPAAARHVGSALEAMLSRRATHRAAP